MKDNTDIKQKKDINNQEIEELLKNKFDELFGVVEEKPADETGQAENEETEDPFEAIGNIEFDVDGIEEDGSSNLPEHIKNFVSSSECREDQREWILSMPWKAERPPYINMDDAAEILEISHFGLNDVKQRIMEFISLQKHLGTSYGAVLLLTGPPGVGKTSIAKSIAKAMRREFVKIPLDGVAASFELKGNEKSWKGAQPGLLTRAISRCGNLCPVILLDEIDKLGRSREWGSPDSVLLEALDSDRKSFIDNFLEVPIDLSNVVFIATANDISCISPILLDRMEIVELRGYTLEEKIEIARNYIIPMEMESHKITRDMLDIKDSALRAMIELYAREPGVRRLQQLVKTICRKAVYYYVTGKQDNLTVERNMLTALLGYASTAEIPVSSRPEAGVTNAIGVTNDGVGIIFPVETSIIPGDGDVYYTGGMEGDVVECCEVAMSVICIRSSKWNLSSDVFDTKDIHIHALLPGIKKTGPSMGLALYTVLVSALLNIPVKDSIAMTGEISLRGKVLPVGMINEKITAAWRTGIKTIFIPEGNRFHIEELPNEILDNIEIVYISDVDEVLERAFVKEEKS